MVWTKRRARKKYIRCHLKRLTKKQLRKVVRRLLRRLESTTGHGIEPAELKALLECPNAPPRAHDGSLAKLEVPPRALASSLAEADGDRTTASQ